MSINEEEKMMIRVIGQVETDINNQDYIKKQQTRYYSPQTTKQKVKSDFQIILDKEMDNLHIDVVI